MRCLGTCSLGYMKDHVDIICRQGRVGPGAGCNATMLFTRNPAVINVVIHSTYNKSNFWRYGETVTEVKKLILYMINSSLIPGNTYSLTYMNMSGL